MSCSRLSWLWKTASVDVSRVARGARRRRRPRRRRHRRSCPRRAKASARSPRSFQTPLVDQRLQAGAIGARAASRRCARRHGGRRARGRGRGGEMCLGGSALRGDRDWPSSGFVERGDGADGGIDQVDLVGKGVAEHAGDAQRHVDARTAELGERHDLEAGDAAGAGLPYRPRADQRQHLRRCRRRRCACSTCPRPTWRSSAATRLRPGNSGARAPRAEARPSAHAAAVGTARTSTE